jgi:hypothetical protein
MSSCRLIWVVLTLSFLFVPAVALNHTDADTLFKLSNIWTPLQSLPSKPWNGSANEACTAWEGVGCANDRVVNMYALLSRSNHEISVTVEMFYPFLLYSRS